MIIICSPDVSEWILVVVGRSTLILWAFGKYELCYDILYSTIQHYTKLYDNIFYNTVVPGRKPRWHTYGGALAIARRTRPPVRPSVRPFSLHGFDPV